MSELFEPGLLYTNHAAAAAGTPFPSLWSYESRSRSPQYSNRPQQQWLHRSDPLLNTILPSTHVSIVVNLGDAWAAGRSLPATAQLPSIAVFGPFTESRLLRVGFHVRALGVVLPSFLTRHLLGVSAPTLVNQIVALDELWPRESVEKLREPLAALSIADGLALLRDACLSGLRLAAHYGISRQRFARRLHEATGISPKLFARITRFQGLVYSLLSTDVSEWAAVAPGAGFYDQAHMINEFRGFAGTAPTRFFQPHDDTIAPARIQLRGRPSEWLRP